MTFRHFSKKVSFVIGFGATVTLAPGAALTLSKKPDVLEVPVVHAHLPVEEAILTFAPDVPPPIERCHPVLLRMSLTFGAITAPLTRKFKYDFWTINDHCPGPFIRARVGDVIEVTVKNDDPSGLPHNIDFHAVAGPGGGAPVLNVEQGKSKTAHFKMTSPGLFVYHCAAAPIPLHLANGMYGVILVEPEEGLSKVDKEYYVMQSEFYTESPDKETNVAPVAYDRGLREDTDIVVFNGREGALTDKRVLQCKTDERVRLFIGNGGPNLMSSFHVIGAIFDKVYRDADLISPPARSIQTTVIPPGGAAVVEIVPPTPGTLTLVDHALFRLDKGCVGFLQVDGEPNPEVYHSVNPPAPCSGCKIHF